MVVNEHWCFQKSRVKRFRQVFDKLRLVHLSADVRVINVVRGILIERSLRPVGVDVDLLALTGLDGLKLDVSCCPRLRPVEQSEQIRTQVCFLSLRSVSCKMRAFPDIYSPRR